MQNVTPKRPVDVLAPDWEKLNFNDLLVELCNPEDMLKCLFFALPLTPNLPRI